MDSLPKCLQDIVYKKLQELYKQDVLNEINTKAKNMIQFCYQFKLDYFCNNIYLSCEEEDFLASDDKLHFIEDFLYEVGELDDFRHFGFPIEDKEKMLFLLRLDGDNDELVEEIILNNNEEHLEVLFNHMLNANFKYYILEKCIERLLKKLSN